MGTFAYGLDPSQSAAVAAGAKTRTIRAAGRRRRAAAGDTVRIYEGLRTKACRLVAEGTCVAAVPVRLTFSGGRLTGGLVDGAAIADADEFARLDGFAGAAEMGAFFERLHGPGKFTGVLIEWRLNENPGAQLMRGVQLL